jgi:hypothetical protein
LTGRKTALEYAKNLRQQGATTSTGEKVSNVRDVIICVIGITYTDKTKYRSCAVLECVEARCQLGARERPVQVCPRHQRHALCRGIPRRAKERR